MGVVFDAVGRSFQKKKKKVLHVGVVVSFPLKVILLYLHS